MATTLDNWTMTRDEETGNYTLTCLDANFDTQEKKIQVNCGNRAMTGDLVVDVKARTANVKFKPIDSGSNVSLYKKNDDYIRVSAYVRSDISTSEQNEPQYHSGWYTGDSYGATYTSVGEIPVYYLGLQAEIGAFEYYTTSPSSITNRKKLILNPNSIYIVLRDNTSCYKNITISNDTLVWDNQLETDSKILGAGAVIWYKRTSFPGTQGIWCALDYFNGAPTEYYSPLFPRAALTINTNNANFNSSTKELTIYLNADKYIREIKLMPSIKSNEMDSPVYSDKGTSASPIIDTKLEAW